MTGSSEVCFDYQSSGLQEQSYCDSSGRLPPFLCLNVSDVFTFNATRQGTAQQVVLVFHSLSLSFLGRVVPYLPVHLPNLSLHHLGFAATLRYLHLLCLTLLYLHLLYLSHTAARNLLHTRRLLHANSLLHARLLDLLARGLLLNYLLRRRFLTYLLLNRGLLHSSHLS